MTTRVLVVDDTSLFRRVISDALAGIQDVEVVGTASNGKLALARIAALRPDLVTLDIEMPEMNGIEVLEAMHVSGEKATVIMLSSLTVKGGQMTIRALEAGAFDFITKPEGKSQDESLLQLRDSLRPIIQTLARQREIRSILKSRAAKPGALSPSGPLVSDATATRTPSQRALPSCLSGFPRAVPPRWPSCCRLGPRK
jgi:two-component system chemotaxis response regulator CheB